MTERATTTMTIRGVDRQTAEHIHRAAMARGWTIATYIEALVELHRKALAAKPAPLDMLLKNLGLEAQRQ